ncbi:3-deoxy-7-phosphoheptulonate synthase [Nocardia terpenica]|uniref:Phospho-2-dehydro-3-deoxyheptonate aldolase n=1 Tax=Nocardia terpenica TaxID=455432 RepID=A0A291RFQ1_9NOCA|nr:3-deoxy-7-phosphoheptulonate synthase [Nocardia terpenica]ATL66431.1 phospho-2-dehydro-3-deoxyheptonate aldolase [Nocardia terpenica]
MAALGTQCLLFRARAGTIRGRLGEASSSSGRGVRIVTIDNTTRLALSSPAAVADAEYWPAGVADQQPNWENYTPVREIHRFLRSRPPLIDPDSIHTLRAALATAAEGEIQVLQAGDCAEDTADTDHGLVSGKVELLDEIAGVMQRNTGKPVLTVGRIAGQFAKPRSRTTELVGGREIPVYRGELVNGPTATHAARRPDPVRLLDGYLAARRITDILGDPVKGDVGIGVGQGAVWTSHEALVLDYEVPFLRRSHGQVYLGSTHWPWIGERTRGPGSAHVELLSRVSNPVSCKVGPNATPEELTGLCGRLDPDREPGRLTFIARMGASRVRDRLPALVRAVAHAGYPVIWMCDPMHGNTGIRADGHKLRAVPVVGLEVERFIRSVTEAGGIPGGLHLETTPAPVHECVDRDETETLVSTTLCDPRLNRRQALAVVSKWRM